MTRKRRKSSSRSSGRSPPSSPPPSTSRDHTSHHFRHSAPAPATASPGGDCPAHRSKDSSDRSRVTGSHKDSYHRHHHHHHHHRQHQHQHHHHHHHHHHKDHRLEDLKVDDENRNGDRRGENGRDPPDRTREHHAGSRNSHDESRKRISTDKPSKRDRKKAEGHARKGESDENSDASRKYGLHKKVKMRSENDTETKPSTGDVRKERRESTSKESIAQKLDKFGEYLRGDHDKDVEEEKKIEKEKPNFKPSGKLAEDTNTYRGVVIKYNEPSDAHMPKLRWRLYPFKGDEALPVLYIHRQSAYLIGRDRKIADLPVDHPSCSKQHAVFQYRLTSMDLSDGTTVKRIRPYIIDLGSANGTYLNNERIEPQRFVELREKDVLKFGYSTREFVLLNEKSNDSERAENAESVVKKEERSPS